ncbi:hypothetical protein [Lysinibacillus fusiformis]|uniref:hypothetical protein n=1 Tax=Lysinibacillus fusiformis TaxID=28031 RepID=UPI0020BF7DD6|nr:hypothetical protein [Lysinibacillus fusiformis]
MEVSALNIWKLLILLVLIFEFALIGSDNISTKTSDEFDASKRKDSQLQERVLARTSTEEMDMHHRLPLNYVDATTANGEFHNSFYSNHSPHEFDIRYDIKNKGTQPFSLKIYNADAKLWAQKNVNAGAKYSTILEKGSYTMSEGVYSISIITADGAEGVFDFAIQIID